MSAKFSPEQIRDYWTRQAVEHGQSHAASWGDQPVIDMEIGEISSRLAQGDRVLDIGCANGYSTVQLAAAKAINIRGLDYIPEMIDNARLRLAEIESNLVGSVDFGVGNVTAIGEPDAAYDKVVCIRVLINLGDWAHQKMGLLECARVLKPGGCLLLSEATVQGWRKMNAFRGEWGLSEIPMPPFNHYLDEQQVVEALAGTMEPVEICNFASTYYVGTRVLKPLLAEALGGRVDVADPNTHWNRWFAQLPAWGDYGTQKLFVFSKL